MTVAEVDASYAGHPPNLQLDQEIGGVVVQGRVWISASVAALGLALVIISVCPLLRRAVGRRGSRRTPDASVFD